MLCVFRSKIDKIRAFWSCIALLLDSNNVYLTDINRHYRYQKNFHKKEKKNSTFSVSIRLTSHNSTRPIHFHRPVVYHDVIAVPIP